MMTPEYEIILVQTAEQRQECYDVVNIITYTTITSILFPIMFLFYFIFLENSRLSHGTKVSSRDRDR